jgi:hypothetical protein
LPRNVDAGPGPQTGREIVHENCSKLKAEYAQRSAFPARLSTPTNTNGTQVKY